MLLLALAACGTAPSPVSSDEVRYYTTEGVEPLSWKLDIYTPDKSSLRASYTNSSPGGIVAGFQWSARGDGAPLQMRWQAVPTGVDIQPRDVVQLTVDGQPAFFGVVTRTWPDDEPDVREYIALGGIELLRYRSHVDPAKYPEQDVAAIARQVISAYKHPAITYDAALIPDLGDTISMPSVYRLELGQILDTLARTVSSKGVTWGVDAQGRAFFGVPSGSVQVGYEESDLRWQPEAGDEVVTRVDLILATTNNNDLQYSTFYGEMVAGAQAVSWMPVNIPIVVSALHQNDAIYGSHRTYSATGLIIHTNDANWYDFHFTNAANAWDGDPTTYAANDTSAGTWSEILTGETENTYGGIVKFELDESAVVQLRIEYQWKNPTTNKTEYVAHWSDDLDLSPGRYNLKMFLLPPSRPYELGVQWTAQVTFYFNGVKTDGGLRVYDVMLLQVDIPAAIEYAKSLLKPPVQKPASVRWDRYQAPTPTATITGAPGGDLTHQAREWRYTWTPERIETVAMLGEAADDEMARAISRVAAVNQAAALSTARALTEPK